MIGRIKRVFQVGLIATAALIALSCGDPASPGTALQAEGRHTALVVHGLLSRISLYADQLPSLTLTWGVEDVVKPLGDRWTFYSPPELAEELIDQEKKPLEEEGKPLPTVFVDSLESGLSLIQVTEFRRVTLRQVSSDTSGTWREFRNALRATNADPVSIVDLRGNPGGSVAICLGMADELVPAGRTLISTENHAAPWGGGSLFSSIPSTDGGLGEERRFVFLANHWSASCSELFLAAVLGNRDDRLVGQATYGKGVGQSLWTLPDGGLLRVTSLRFWGPDGRSWNGVGIAPDLELADREEQLTAAVDLAREMAGSPSTPLLWGEAQSRLSARLFAEEGSVEAIASAWEFSPLSSEQIFPADSIGAGR